MNRYLLDTSILSDATKPMPAKALAAWMEKQEPEDLFIAAWTIAEIWRGILEKPAGAKRRLLEEWFSGPEGPPTLFEGRVLPFDERSAVVWAELMAEGTARGKPRSPFDTAIAAVAVANNCVVATANEKDFRGVRTLNPARTAD